MHFFVFSQLVIARYTENLSHLFSSVYSLACIPDSPVRERAHRTKSANVKYNFDDSDQDEGTSSDDKESFKVVDHGQGPKDLELPVAPPMPVTTQYVSF